MWGLLVPRRPLADIFLHRALVPTQGRFYVGAGEAQAPQMLASPPPQYFGSNSKNTHS